MFRDRTNLYISYRRTYPHHNPLDHETLQSSMGQFDRLREEEEGLMNDGLGEEDDAIQLKSLPPNFIELSQEIEDILKFIEQKVNELNYLYKKNLLPGFNDNSIDMKKIDDLSFTITKNFQKTYNMIKKIDNLKRQSTLNQDEIMMCENIKKKLAMETQNLSKDFRKLQNNYIKFLKVDDDYETSFQNNSKPYSSSSAIALDDEPSTEIESYSREALRQSQTVLLEEQEPTSQQDQMMKQREEEISKIAMGVIEISTIFRELENMIIDQGTILDRIDYNLNNVTVDLQKADKELIKSSKTQKRTQKCKLIMLLTLVVFALFLMVMLRPKHVVVDHKYGGDNNNNNSNNNGNNDNNNNNDNNKNSNGNTDGASNGDVVGSRPVIKPDPDAADAVFI